MSQHVVPESKAQALRSHMQSHIEGFEVLYKSERDQWPDDWRLDAIKWLVWLVGLIVPAFAERFWTEISNGFGPYLILPDRSWSDWTDPTVYKVVRHEYIHMIDSRDHPSWWMMLTYFLLPFPTMITGRAYWEYRAYAVFMMAEYEHRGEISDATIQWIADQFTSSLYLWMFPFRSIVVEMLERTARDIEEGKIKGLDPDVKPFRYLERPIESNE